LFVIWNTRYHRKNLILRYTKRNHILDHFGQLALVGLLDEQFGFKAVNIFNEVEKLPMRN
jgi:hypothetical protein